MLDALIHQHPTEIVELRPETPAELRDTVRMALEKDPSQRFQSAGAVLTSLAGSPGRQAGRRDALGSDGSTPRRSNLPDQRGSFIGREEALETVRNLVLDGPCRIVTLTGSGGTGKTSLALAAAESLRSDFSAGVFWVPLASLADPDLLLATIAKTLDARGIDRLGVTEALEQRLEHRRLLLVLDNFEHVVAAAPLLATLVSRCTELHVLVTSRAVLTVSDEQELVVPPLAVPDSSTLANPAELARFPAVRLFVTRARRVQPAFALTDENAQDVAFICRRLDGLPLAIELAAARVKVLQPSQLRCRLEHSLNVLTTGARDAPRRQRTLRDTIRWSYDLLAPEHQTLFKRLSVFAPGCSLEAAEEVCAERADEVMVDELSCDPLDGLASLVDSSLLVPHATHADGSRFDMLQTVREFAVEQLVASGEEPALRRRHATDFVSLAEEAEPRLHGADQAQWLDRLEREHDNLRSAFGWLIENGDADACLRLGASLGRFWRIHGHLAEGRGRVRKALSMQGADTESIPRCRALQSAGWLLRDQGEYDLSRTLFEESLELAHRIEYTAGVAWALIGLGFINRYRGEHEQARDHLTQARELARTVDDREALGASLGHLVAVARDLGDYSGARPLLEESLANYEALGDSLGIAWTNNNLGLVATALAEYEEAQRFHERALRLYEAIGDRQNIAFTRNNLGLVARGVGDFRSARSLHKQALAELAEVGDKRGIAFVLESLALVAAQEGRSASAVTIAAAASALRSRVSASAPPAWSAELQKHLVPARQNLGADELKAAERRSQAWSTEEAVQYALSSD